MSFKLGIGWLSYLQNRQTSPSSSVMAAERNLWDEYWLVVDKPAGLDDSRPTNQTDTLLNQLRLLATTRCPKFAAYYAG